MRTKRTDASGMAAITSEDMSRFHRNAPAALARRGGGFLGEQLASAFELFLAGLAPIVGMLVYGWSANQLLVFLLVGAWTAIILDIAKLVLLYEAVKRFGAAHYEDWHVWVVANALRAGRNEAVQSHLEAKYQPEIGVFIDLVCGGIGTVFILIAASGESLSGFRDLFGDRTLLYGVACLVGYQFLVAAWEIARRMRSKDHGELKVALGMRGLGLFVLMFVVVMIRESSGELGTVALAVMLAVNAALIVMALFNALGQLWVRGETRWLREYLRERGKPASGRSKCGGER